MNNNAIEALHHRTFESIKQTSETGAEYWSARALQPLLEYGTWDKFRRVIDKAAEACERSGNVVADHFSQVGKMVELGSGAQRALEDFHLSRYACYLIVQNGDPSKPVIANGQTYFAMQTRRQELADEATFARFGEDEKRLAIRNELATHNKHLAAAAKEAGVETPIEYAVFQDHGYKGLYGGLGNKEIHAKKGLKKNQKILDHMGSTELAANLFRATQTEEKLRRDGIKGKQHANRTHHEVGKKVRQTIQELGGTMPEELPTPETSIKQLQLGQKKLPK
ncbi:MULTISPECIES: DNA damage-inducible protein D [Burkholderia]|uniref:DNA-damage-inducible protein D n=3 Tax=pseudomallei group TaxID=111527 RepID=A0AAI8B6H8_9BURK|nr:MULTISPECIES: DNA damage-inducible protein D [Burkholderia]AIO66637.1 putative dNA-damage-inducible protein D [Burkholderia oklahomensis]AIP23486.1 putative dNA-damage-inducible protein D [Burkholderia pseudomallei MSHR5855]AIP41061.1 putative dNA-damage-inducible protein D [Burkholderia pseudomallei MSHR5848]KGD58171.1 putative dNA-damage-inducible protein D [Burkholderia pseudomallei]KGS67055.1 putative dNA-damage-inducible protein D [Burkholderia pseudomallei MSHR7527]